MDIRCRKSTCKYNKTHTCMAKSILIDNNIKCVTYEVDEQKKIIAENKDNDMTKDLFEKETRNSSHRSRKTIDINCKADCIFNKNGKCNANGITVNDLQYPYCITFLKR